MSLRIFRTCPIIFGRLCWWRMWIIFKWFSVRALLSICFIFCQFQPGVAYKSVTYKTSMYITNITSKHFTKWCFAFWFYNVIRTMAKRRWHISEIKTMGKTKQCYHNDISSLKRDIFSSEVETRRGIVWIKILKMRIYSENYNENYIQTLPA